MDKNKFVEYQMIEQQIQSMSQNMENLEKSMEDLQNLLTTLDEFKSLKKNDKLLISVANGIFAEATLQNPENLIVNVGNNVTVKKNIENSKKMIQEQITDLEKYKEESMESYQTLYNKLALLQQELMNSETDKKEKK